MAPTLPYIHDRRRLRIPGARGPVVHTDLRCPGAAEQAIAGPLEIASGRGEAACALVERFGCRVEAFDIDPNMVESARGKAAAWGLDELVSFEVKDGRNLDFGDGYYDLILAEGGALTYVGREDGVERCASLLKDGRTLAILDPMYPSKDVPAAVRKAYEEGVFSYLTEIEYRQLLEKHGFEITQLSLLPQSAWDRYYMGMQRRIARPGGSGHGRVPQRHAGRDRRILREKGHALRCLRVHHRENGPEQTGRGGA
jgi:hypothetical protein